MAFVRDPIRIFKVNITSFNYSNNYNDDGNNSNDSNDNSYNDNDNNNSISLI